MAFKGLIGYTGFVGHNLRRLNQDFELLYNTQNIDSIGEQPFELLVCAAPQAKKWWANQNPDADWSMVESLIKALQTAAAERFVLISTIDVFPTITGADESFDCTSLDNHAYGRHRLKLEQAVAEHFPKCHIVRLPALFGPGLKKNIIFDMLHHNQVEKINPACQFQWYDLGDLWADIECIIGADIPIAVLATEPIVSEEIHARFFPEVPIGDSAGPTVIYDIHTRYADVFGNQGRYIRSKEQILKRLGNFVAAEKGLTS